MIIKWNNPYEAQSWFQCRRKIHKLACACPVQWDQSYSDLADCWGKYWPRLNIWLRKQKTREVFFFFFFWCHLPISICACVLSHLSHVWLFVTPWTVAHQDFPGKNTRVGCHVLLQGIFLTQGLNLSLLSLLHWQADSLPLAPSILFWLFLRFIYLFLAVLSLCCCARSFSSCASRGYFLAVVLPIAVVLLWNMGCRRLGFTSCDVQP